MTPKHGKQSRDCCISSVLGLSQEWRYLGGRTDPGGVGGGHRPIHGPVLGLQAAAPTRLAQAGSERTATAK